jgi:hypothetical protein
MMTVIGEYTTEKQHSVVRFFWGVKELNIKDIHKEIFLVHCGKCSSRKMVHNWVEKFSHVILKLSEDARPLYAISWEVMLTEF